MLTKSISINKNLNQKVIPENNKYLFNNFNFNQPSTAAF